MSLRIAIILAVCSCCVPAAWGQGTVRDDFEGAEPVLRPVGGDVRHQVELHQRVGEGVHGGRWCEHLRVAGNNGTAIYYSYPIRPARIIGELAGGLWIRADRPGLQIVVRVVLPRSKHPDSGEPLTTLMRGADYRQVGSWQWLHFDNLPHALQAQVRVLRAQFGPDVDPREAYIDRVLLNVYGGPGTTNVWVDDFELIGAVAPSGAQDPRDALASYTAGAAAAAEALPSMPAIELRSRLLVGGEPFFPRIIEHRGEPLVRLKALGFNCVRVRQLPGDALLAEAAREKMWLIAPPPTLAELTKQAEMPGSNGQIPAAFDPVLAWDLGSGLSLRDLEPARRWAERVLSVDPRSRPIVVAADSELDEFTRPPFKVLLVERDVLGTSLELSDYADWLRGRSQLARAAAPLWATIATQPDVRLVEQMRLVSGRDLALPAWHEAQLRSLVHAALAGRARGLSFSSQSRLDAPDPASQMRAATLELINLELALIERWPAAGSFSAVATTSDPHTSGAVLETDRSRLLLPIHAPPGGQFSTGTQAAAQVSCTVAGVPEGDNAYEVSLAALRPLRSERVAGGTRVVLDEFSRESLVVYTQDPRIIRALKTSLDKNSRRAAQLARFLAGARLAEHDAIARRLAPLATSPPGADEAHARAEGDLRQCDALLSIDRARGCDFARHALQIVRQIERVGWEQATAGQPALADPLTASFATLDEHYRLAGQILVAPKSGNRLGAGDCENLNEMLRAGWQHYVYQLNGIQTSVNATPLAAHSGTAGLLLEAKPAVEGQAIAVVETPPVWVTTAPVVVEPGDLVQIQAWVKIDVPIAGSVEGLVVVDTMSGRPLALTLKSTTGWQQLTFVRGATASGPLAVTFALAGLGTAAIDDVTLEIIRRAPLPPQHALR